MEDNAKKNNKKDSIIKKRSNTKNNIGDLTSLFEEKTNDVDGVVFSANINTLTIDESQPPREYFKKTMDMIRQMYADGMQERFPILVIKEPLVNNRYIVIDGLKRLMVAKELGLSSVYVEITRYSSRIDFYINARKIGSFTPLEHGHILNQIKIDRGNLTGEKIAKIVDMKTPAVSIYLRMLILPECIQYLYDNDICRDVHTINSLRYLYKSDNYLVERALKATSGSFRREDLAGIRKLVSQAKYDRAALPPTRKMTLERFTQIERDIYILARKLIEKNVPKENVKDVLKKFDNQIMAIE